MILRTSFNFALVGLAWSAILVACTGEIHDAEHDLPQLTEPEPDMPMGPVEPDFGPITMTPERCLSEPAATGVAPMRLLTRLEYDNTIRDLLDAPPIASEFPPENLANGFENNAYVHTVSPLLLREYLEAGELIARQSRTRVADLVPCEVEAGDAVCAEGFVRSFVPKAFRRPLEPEELRTFVELAQTGIELFDFTTSIELIIAATLQSPQFLYRIEFEDGSDSTMIGLDHYEVASRLSYFLWHSMPDADLFLAAARGELGSAEEIEVHTRRMLEDPKADGVVRAFYRQWLGLGELSSIVKDSATYPSYDPAMNQAWADSALAFVSHVYGPEGSGSLRELYTSSDLFLDDSLAVLYGAAPAGEFAKHTLPEEERAGLITHPALMAILANAEQSSPVRRGVFVREKLLCQGLPAPPADLVVMPPDPDPNATTRERFAEHTESDVCASCHVLIDPVGFGFEYYDSMGIYRTEENGFAVDGSGDFVDSDPELTGEFVGGVELAHRIAESDLAANCLAETWFIYALGRQFGNNDACNFFDVSQAFAETGDLRELLVSITTSDSFRFRRSQPLPQEM